MAQAAFGPQYDEKMERFELLSGHYTFYRRDSVFTAISAIDEAGYRHVDTAAEYGVQDQVGRGIKAAIEREHLFITSELRRHIMNCSWTYLLRFIGHFTREMEQAGPRKLGTFWISTWKEYGRKWRNLSRTILLRDIGISNFTVKKLDKLLSFAQIKPSVCQMEMHPGWRNDKMFDACKKHDIHATAYSPLGSQGGRDLLHDPVVEKISRKLNQSRGQVLLRWAIQRGTSTIPKSNNPDKIIENLHVFWWQIPDQDFRTLSIIPDQKRVLDGGSLFVTETNGPYKSTADVWDHET